MYLYVIYFLISIQWNSIYGHRELANLVAYGSNSAQITF